MGLTPAQHRNFDRLVMAAKRIIARRDALPEGHPQIANYNANIAKYDRWIANGISSDAVPVFHMLINES